jgi:4-diphosphocytidyl-2-C-methyl-D-erythritol kinase
MSMAELAPAKVNLALHVRGKRADGRHDLETIFAFCVDGDVLVAEPSEGLTLDVIGPFAAGLECEGDNLVLRAARALADQAGQADGAKLTLTKNLPVASGIGGGSADAAAALRLLTRMWKTNPSHAATVAPLLGSDVPACLLSMTARGEGAGDKLRLFDAGVADSPILLVNPLVGVSTAAVFAAWNGEDHGPLGDWRDGRNDLEAPARNLAPEIGDVLEWLARQPGTKVARMSGSGATCFALFDCEEMRDAAAEVCPSKWWRLPSFLR